MSGEPLAHRGSCPNFRRSLPTLPCWFRPLVVCFGLKECFLGNVEQFADGVIELFGLSVSRYGRRGVWFHVCSYSNGQVGLCEINLQAISAWTGGVKPSRCSANVMYAGFNSIPIKLRPCLSATTPVVPDPAK